MIEQKQELETSARTPSAGRSASPLGTVLVVDDEAELRKILVEALTRQGFEVIGCSVGHQALAELRTKNIDLLLTDLMMPTMDGISLLKSALEIDPHLVGIIMTGQGTIQTAIDAMKLGAFDYVLKPFLMQTLLPVLTRAMNVRHLRLENLQLRETVAIHGLCQTIAFTLDPQTVLSKLADSAVEQSDADEVSILLPTNDGTELYVAMVRGEKRERLLGEHIPLQGSISSWVARERVPLILNGEVRDERFTALWPRPEIRSAVSVPMQVANRLVGIINLNVTNRMRPFTLGQMKALSILASTAAAALESASLYTQVQQAEQRYRSIFENAVEGIFQATAGRQFITVNPSVARILGYESPEEVIRSFTNIGKQLYVEPEVAAEVAKVLEQSGILRGFEFEAYRKDGEKIWLSLNIRVVRDETGAEVCREGTIEGITERKRAEDERARLTAEIESQRLRLNSIVASVPGVVWEAWGQPDAATQQIDFVSDYIETMLGYSVEECLSTPNFWLTIVHPDDRERTSRLAAAAFAEVKGCRLEFRWLRKDGSSVWVDSNFVVVSDDAGQPRGLRGVNTDITDRKRAESQLRDAKEFSENLIQTANVIILGLDLEGNINIFNQTAEEITGYTAADLKGKNWFETLTPKEKYPSVWTELNRLINGGLPRTFENALVTRSGEERQILWQNNQIRVDGKIVGIISFGNDITERKRAEAALRESEERYRDLVENAHDIIYSHDLQGNYTSMNKAGEQITGYTAQESLSLDIERTVAPEHIEKVREMVRRKLAGEKVTAYEMEIIAKDGHRVTVEANTKLVYQNGVPIGVQGIARDVTERKHLEEQLRQSQKMEAIGQLAGGVAHDFNNLLTAINGYSGLALQKIDDDHPLKGYLEEIKKAGDRAANLTRQLLAFGRKQILQPLALNLNDVVTDMSKMLRRLIGEDIEFHAKLDPALRKTKADPGQIEQVLVNLVVNARDAMPQGGNLTIETTGVDLNEDYASRHVGVVPGHYVMLAVSDTGTGMDEATQARIFDPFFTTKEKGKGTGLGLSTVYGIVKQSGGNIWVYSEPLQGTTFKVYLPELAGATPKVITEAVERVINGGSETILLVEDEDVVRRLACKILENVGYSVLEASRGQEAIRLCLERKEPIDLLLTDVVMPETSGKEVADRLSEMQPGLRVLFMSGYTDEAIVHHGVLDLNVEFIQKPFTPAGLTKKVREVLDSELMLIS
jgi:PAS domain S-box-containing protein